MIVGVFRDGLPYVSLTVYDASGATHEIEFVLDTGFNGGLTLTPALMRQLGVRPTARVRNRLANGAEDYAEAGSVTIALDKTLVEAQAVVYADNPLLGTELLTDWHIYIEAAENGEVLIEPL